MKKTKSQNKYNSIESLFKGNRLGAQNFQKNVERLGISTEEALKRMKTSSMRSSTSSKKSTKSRTSKSPIKKFFSKLIKK